MSNATIDIAELRRLWESDWSVPDLARRFGCSETYIRWLRHKHDFADRSQSKEPAPPSAADADASADSLALSPWVAARAAEFRRGKEQRGESVYPGVHLRTYSARSLRLIAD